MKPLQDLDWDVADAVRKHGLYLKQYSGGQQADFRHKTLRGTMLAAADLRQALFAGADLRGSNFAGSIMSLRPIGGRPRVTAHQT